MVTQSPVLTLTVQGTAPTIAALHTHLFTVVSSETSLTHTASSHSITTQGSVCTMAPVGAPRAPGPLLTGRSAVVSCSARGTCTVSGDRVTAGIRMTDTSTHTAWPIGPCWTHSLAELFCVPRVTVTDSCLRVAGSAVLTRSTWELALQPP